MKLSNLEYLIFTILEKNPLKSARTLAKETDYTLYSINEALKKLKNQNFIRNERMIIDSLLGERIQNEVEGRYSTFSLSLKQIHVQLSNLTTKSQIKQIRSIIASHPYIHYISQVLGTNIGLYCIFHIPEGVEKKINTFIQALSKNFDLKINFLYVCDNPIRSNVDFSNWDRINNQWVINTHPSDTLDHLTGVASPENAFEEIWNDTIDILLHEKNTYFEPKTVQQDIREIDELDLLLVRELTINAKPNIKSISPYYKKDVSTISRRLKFIKENYFEYFSLYYDHSYFDLSFFVLFHGKFTNKGIKQEELQKFIQKNVFPFNSSLIINQNDFVWTTQCTPLIFQELTEFIIQNFANVSYHPILQRTGFRYFFFPQNYQWEQKKWLNDDASLIYEPLEIINK
jgi:DNA-binding Lrp family transcriptional regulator